jgi:hypothetical protein
MGNLLAIALSYRHRGGGPFLSGLLAFGATGWAAYSVVAYFEPGAVLIAVSPLLYLILPDPPGRQILTVATGVVLTASLLAYALIGGLIAGSCRSK